MSLWNSLASETWNIYMHYFLIHFYDKKHINSSRQGEAYMRQQTKHRCFRQWLVAWLAPSHYLNQCWDVANWTLRNKLWWNLSRNSNIFIQENASFENIVWKMAAICLGLNVLRFILVNLTGAMSTMLHVWVNVWNHIDLDISHHQTSINHNESNYSHLIATVKHGFRLAAGPTANHVSC